MCLLDVDGYTNLGAEPSQRVGKVLGGLNSDRAHNTERFVHKFMDNVNQAFATPNRPVNGRSFFENDFLPLRNLDEEVKEVAVSRKLNKSEAKALQKVKENAPQKFRDMAIGDQGTHAWDPPYDSPRAPLLAFLT